MWESNVFQWRIRIRQPLKPRFTDSWAEISVWAETWGSGTFIVEKEGSLFWGWGEWGNEEGWESVWVHRVHWKGLTLSFLSCNLSFSLSSLLADLNNLSHIIYLLLTHTHTHTSWGLDPGAGVGWSSWNLHREKPDSRPLCQTHEVTLSDWPCLPACLCSISASRFNLSVTEKLRKDAKVVAS